MTITLWKSYAVGETDYIARLNNNAEIIENALNQIFAQLTGQAGSLAVPLGLQEIFDRRGLIGAGSYDFTEGNLLGSAYQFTVQPGAYWNAGTFYQKSATSTLSLAGLAVGTYYLNLDAAGNPLVSPVADATTTRAFTWSGSAISDKTLAAGVAMLLSGDDYAHCLASVPRGKSFLKVADRLEEIEVLLGKNVQTTASADQISIDWSLGSVARVLLNRATTTFSFSGAYDGQKLVLELKQDATGSRQVAFGPETVAGTDFTFPVPLSGAGKRDFLGFFYSADSGKYHYVSLARGY
jgi:hypothetical protein